jgi:2-polyprenyl-6-methoxyphenol hydroxylase-like FAD-dependent oxidoreductase
VNATNKSPELRILICGAGIAGPALAIWLRRYGFAPTLIEHAPAFRDGGYMIDVWGVGYDLIERMGLLPQALKAGYRIEHVRFVDAGGNRVSGFDGDVFRLALNGRFFSIPRGDLANLIYDTLDVETRFSTSIESLQDAEDGVEVTFNRGPPERFDLVIGADGLRSRVRECAFGPEQDFEKYLGYYAASFVTQAYPHRDENTYLSYSNPGRSVARYALRDGRSAFLFVFERDRQISAREVSQRKTILRETFGRDGWETPEILRCMDEADELYFDAVSQIRMPAWSKGRVALVGDAAHCPSLMAGAGSAFAMLGACILGGELHKAGGDHAKAFAAYEGRMRGFIDKQQRDAEKFAPSFAPRTRFGLFARDAVLNLLKFRALAIWFTRRNFANAFDLPDYS